MRATLEPAAREIFGPNWIRPLAEAAGWSHNTLRTLMRRGKRMPPANRLAALYAAAKLSAQPLQKADATKLLEDVLEMPLRENEQRICFPLLRALIELYRRNDDTFDHLLKQTRLLLKAEGDPDNAALLRVINAFEVVTARRSIARNLGEEDRVPRARRLPVRTPRADR